MTEIVSLISRHGYVVIVAVVFAEAIGLPVPAAVALVAAGAASGSRVLQASVMLPVALAGMMLGDTLLFVAGRYTGWSLLGFLCKVSANPETCILRSAESFYKRGRVTLVVAKFIPGVNSMAAPLAGSMKMRFGQFLALDLAGASCYALAYGGIGFVFRDFVKAITRGFRVAGRATAIAVIVALIAFIAYRVWLYSKYRVYRIVPRVQVMELAEKLQSEESEKVLLVDVRSHGYYDAGAARIKGSFRIEPNNLSQEIAKLPRDKDVYLYCT